MQFQSKNINKDGLITLFYIKIILQVLFQICFYIPDLHWLGDNIRAQVDLIQYSINLQYINTPSLLQSKCIIITYEKKQNINQVCV